jgi:hypothetical protein
MVRRFRVGKSWGEYVLVDLQRKVEALKGGGQYVRYDGGIYKLSDPKTLAEFVKDAQAKGRKVSTSGVRLSPLGELPALPFFKEWLKPLRSY